MTLNTKEWGARIFWTDQYGEEAYGLTDKILVLVFGDEAGESVGEMLALGANGDGRSLANDEEFETARSQFQGPRLASGFVNVRRVLRLAKQGELDGYGFSNVSVLANEPTVPDWVAMSIRSVDRGFAAEIVMPDEGSSEEVVDLPDVDDVGEWLPADTVGFFATAFETDVDEWRRELEELEYGEGEFEETVRELYEGLYLLIEGEAQRPPREVEDPDVADVLDLGLELVEVYTGVDPEKGVFRPP